MTMRPGKRRDGLTLLEVIVSMAIFLISVTALYQLVLMGGERAMDVRLQTRTSMRCQSKLAELMIGAESLSSSGSYANFSEEYDKDLQWKVEASESTEAKGLWTVKVTVKAELSTGKIIESQLCQMMLDPAIRGTTFDQPDTAPPGTATKDAPETTTPETKTPDSTTPKEGATKDSAPKTKDGGAKGTGPKTNGPPNTNGPKLNTPPNTKGPNTTPPKTATKKGG